MKDTHTCVERLNIPISNSLLHKQEYNNIINIARFHNEKRRATSEKNTSKYIDNRQSMCSYRTEYVK